MDRFSRHGALRRWSRLSFVLLPFTLGCSGVSSVLLDSTDGSPNISSPEGGVTVDAGDAGGDGQTNDAGSGCDITACATIPDGFTVVGFSNGAIACPTGWTSTSVVSAPIASSGTCSCSCNVTAQPGCNTGSITRYLDDSTSPMCNELGTTLTTSGSSCDYVGALYLDHEHYSVTAPSPTGGTCEFDAQTDTTKVTSTPGLVCAPPASCLGAICNSGNVCVSQSGDVPCPAGFPAKTLVGASASATCSACGSSCAVSSTCTGTLAFYTDSACATTPVDFTADGTCDANPTTDIGPYYYYKYTGSVASASCAGPIPQSTPTVGLNAPTTVCCQH